MGLFKSIGKIAKTVVQGPTSLLGSSGMNRIAQAGLGYLTNGVSGAIGVGSDFLDSNYNQQMQKDMANYNASQQSALNNQAFQQNLQMWNLKNQYDSPAEQMKRYEAAGLNKNLIYGQSNTSGNMPELSAATYDTGQYKPVDTRMQRAQLQLALAEQHQRVTNQAIENDLARQRLFLAERNANREDALARAQIVSLGSNLGLTKARIYDIENSPKSFIGRAWYDIKHIGKRDLGIGNGISPELF